MVSLPELPRKKIILISVVATVSVIGTFLLLGSGSVRIGDIFNALSDINPRVMGLMALPFIVVFVLAARYLLKKREERMWKNALLKTRAARQEEEGRKKA